MPPRSERAQNLVNFVRDEVERFRIGKIYHISTNEELRTRFGYSSTSSLYTPLGKEGLIKERKRIKEHEGEEKQEVLLPSDDFAWLIGVVAGGGNNNLSDGAITVSSADERLLQAVKSIGETLFLTNGYIDEVGKKKNKEAYWRLHFHNRNVSRQLGDLRRTEWTHTVFERHKWILSNPHYTWRFLEGFFEVRGVFLQPQGILFTTTFLDVANFLIDLLTRVGIENPRVHTLNKAKEKINGVGIYNLKDIKLFAQSIHSQIQDKEEILNLYRLRPLDKIIPSSFHGKEEKIKEWRRLTKLLGRGPKASEIAALRKQRLTRYAVDTYAYNFGRADDGKMSFAAARERLAILLKQDETEGEVIPMEPLKPAWRKVHSREQLIEEYRRAREFCLAEKGRLPTIPNYGDLRKKDIVEHTAHTLANFFGDRSFIKAREVLEKIIKDRGEAKKSQDNNSNLQETQIFP